MKGQLSNAAEAFTLNILRFKNFRQRMGRAHDREAGTLQEVTESFKQEAAAYFDLLRREPASVADLYAASSAERLGENALSWGAMFERQLEMVPDEAALGREMAFVYLMAILDGFIARWRVDMGLDSDEDSLKAARPNVIRETCRELGIAVNFPEGFVRTLEEMRERRNVLVHRGAIADARYCGVAGRPEVLSQRIDVTEEYLDRADRFVTELGLDLIARSPRR